MLENIKLFATNNNRLSYEDSEDYIEPYVSLVEGDNSVHYNKGGDTPKKTFKWKYSFEDDSSFQCGEVKKGNEDFLIAEVYGKIGTGCGEYNPSGQLVTFSEFSIEKKRDIAIAIAIFFNKEVSDVNIVASPVEVGETIENFDTDFITL